MFGNPGMQRQDPFQAGMDTPYFWNKGSFRSRSPTVPRRRGQRLERRGLRFRECHPQRHGLPSVGPGLLHQIGQERPGRPGGDTEVLRGPLGDKRYRQRWPGLSPDRVLSARQDDLTRWLGFWSIDLPTTGSADGPVHVDHGPQPQGGRRWRRPVRGGRVPGPDRPKHHAAVPRGRRCTWSKPAGTTG